jgi:hypothetical protein
MKILFVSYSRTGNTQKTTEKIKKELEERGHEVVTEKIKLKKELESRWLVLFDMKVTLSYFLGLALRKDILPRREIEPVSFPNISQFDRVCITTPKWGSVPPQICKYIDIVEGLEGKKVAVFASYYCPPYKYIELKAIFGPFKKMISKKQGEVVVMMGATTDFLERGIKSFKAVIWILNLIRFGKPFPKDWRDRSPYFISEKFKPVAPYKEEAIKLFCDKIEN